MSEAQQLHFATEQAPSRARRVITGAFAHWRGMSLAAQFAAAAAIVIGIGMAVLGTWVAARIQAGVIRHTALAAALYMDRFVEPHVQELASGATLSQASRDALTGLLARPGLDKKILDIRIWRLDGTIMFSRNAEMIGQRFPVEDRLKAAANGTVGAEFDELDSEENIGDKQLHEHLLEIYAPVREAGTERIIAVAEIYQVSGQLASELRWARVESVLAVCGLGVVMLGALSGIVLRGSRTIASQQKSLSERVEQLSRLLAQNTELRQRVAEANRRASEGNERFLRRVSAELHDGPVQLIGLVLLRLDSLVPKPKDAPPDKDLEIVRGALKDALSEIRDVSHGLALPELENLNLTAALDIAITNHERRSGTLVDIDHDEHLPAHVPGSVKTCAYRFVQEGLNNAFHHAGGAGQCVATRWDGKHLTVEVSDKGGGIVNKPQTAPKCGLGLPGLRDRIEALSGAMTIVTGPEGTTLRAVFPLNNSEV